MGRNLGHRFTSNKTDSTSRFTQVIDEPLCMIAKDKGKTANTIT